MKMNDKPTLEEMEAAYRRYIERVDQIARELEPAEMPALRRWELQESVPSWRAVVAAMATAALILFALPDTNACETSAHADRAACMARVEMILDSAL